MPPVDQQPPPPSLPTSQPHTSKAPIYIFVVVVLILIGGGGAFAGWRTHTFPSGGNTVNEPTSSNSTTTAPKDHLPADLASDPNVHVVSNTCGNGNINCSYVVDLASATCGDFSIMLRQSHQTNFDASYDHIAFIYQKDQPVALLNDFYYLFHFIGLLPLPVGTKVPVESFDDPNPTPGTKGLITLFVDPELLSLGDFKEISSCLQNNIAQFNSPLLKLELIQGSPARVGGIAYLSGTNYKFMLEHDVDKTFSDGGRILWGQTGNNEDEDVFHDPPATLTDPEKIAYIKKIKTELANYAGGVSISNATGIIPAKAALVGIQSTTTDFDQELIVRDAQGHSQIMIASIHRALADLTTTQSLTLIPFNDLEQGDPSSVLFEKVANGSILLKEIDATPVGNSSLATESKASQCYSYNFNTKKFTKLSNPTIPNAEFLDKCL